MAFHRLSILMEDFDVKNLLRIFEQMIHNSLSILSLDSVKDNFNHFCAVIHGRLAY